MKNKITYYTIDSKIEDNSAAQIENLIADGNVESVCIFPDIHYCSEKLIPVGLTFATKDVIYPLVTGKDTGCGVAYMKIPKTDMLKPFDKDKHYNAFHKEHLTMTDEGLGGGNHFLSLEEDDKNLYIIVHTGTRNRGIYMYQKNLSLLKEFGNDNYVTVEFLEKYHPEWFTEYNDLLVYSRKRRNDFLKGTEYFLIRNGYLTNPFTLKSGYMTIRDAYEIGDSIHNHIKKEGDYWIHRKGATELNDDVVVVPLSMTRGSLLVKKAFESVNHNSCSHGAGRKLSRTDTLKHWHSLKKKTRKEYENQFSELLDRSGKFSHGYIQEFDFAYKDSDNILQEQPFLKKVSETKPICTIKFTEI